MQQSEERREHVESLFVQGDFIHFEERLIFKSFDFSWQIMNYMIKILQEIKPIRYGMDLEGTITFN